MAINLKPEADKALAALSQGQPKAAYKIAKAALRKSGGEPFFNNLAGLALCAQSRQRDALPYFQKAVRANPDFVDAQKNLAQTLILLGDQARAQAVLERLSKRFPQDADLTYMTALMLSQGDDLTRAEASADRAIDLAPTLARGYNLRGILRRRVARLNGSIADFNTALELSPDDPEILSNLALSLSMNSATDAALDKLNRALELAPDNVNVLHRHAGLLTEMGDAEGAIASYRRILQCQPDHAIAFANIATQQEPDAATIAQLKATYSKLAKRAPERVDLGFALWTLLRKSGAVQEAEDWLTRANRLAFSLSPYDTDRLDREQDLVRAQFPATRPVARNDEDSGPRAIFVLGLIRSGTSLTEQILTCAPGVFGAGELSLAGSLADRFLSSRAAFDATAAKEFAAAYRAELPPLPKDTQAFVDKMPDNFQRIGFLKASLPDCRIINLQRDPRDTALSIYSTHMPDQKLGFSTDFRAMAHYFNAYQRMMQYWHSLFPGEILDLGYEDMVGDIETASRRLAEFCGLDWTPQMASPERNKRAVRTASALQVRQPVHRKSVGGWQRHSELLAPFIAELDADLWPGINPASG